MSERKIKRGGWDAWSGNGGKVDTALASRTITNTNLPFGWVCPRCGQCYSPFVLRCGTCGPATTSGNTSNL
jgi:hypothetical protein